MRREFILLLLGIICISTISSILSGFVQSDSDTLLLDTVAGAVGAGNFSYWQLGHTGPLLVELTSLEGDADLYVSDTVRPSYEIDKNNFSSITCGIDIISIPTDFPRPIGIGVFGHWSHAVSEYSIQVFLQTTAVLSDEQLHAVDKSPYTWKPDRTEGDKKFRDKSSSRKSEPDENKPRFLKLLSILDMVFDMFVL